MKTSRENARRTAVACHDAAGRRHIAGERKWRVSTARRDRRTISVFRVVANPDQRVGRRRRLPPGLAQTAIHGGPGVGREAADRCGGRYGADGDDCRLNNRGVCPGCARRNRPRDHNAAMMTVTRVPHAPMPGGPELAVDRRRGRGGRRVWNCLGHSRFRALRMPASASLPRRSNAGLSSGAAMQDRPLKVNSAV